MKTPFLLGLSILLCIFFGCGNSSGVGDDSDDSYVPRIRLVKDGTNEFHFQWDGPLKEERIVLCRYDVFILVTTDSPEPVRREVSGFPTQSLIYFPKGALISEPVRDNNLIFVEILSAQERDSFALPAHASDATIPSSSQWFWFGGEARRILREHPFKPYQIGEPSRLTFASEPRN